MESKQYAYEDTPRGLVVRCFGVDERDLRVSIPLSELVSGQSVEQGLVADVIFPPVPVGNRTGYAPMVAPESWKGIEGAVRATAAKPWPIGLNVSSVWFMAKNYAFVTNLPWEDTQGADPGYRLQEAAAKFLRTVSGVSKERRVMNTITASGNALPFVPASAWNSGGDPISAIQTMISNVQSASGFRPTMLFAGAVAWQSIQTNTLAKNSLGSFVTPGRAAEFFRVNTVLIGDGFNAELVKFGSWRNPADDAVGVFVQQGTSGADYLPRYAISPYWTPPGVTTRFAIQVVPSPVTHAEQVLADTWEAETVLDRNLGAVIRGVNSAQSSGI